MIARSENGPQVSHYELTPAEYDRLQALADLLKNIVDVADNKYKLYDAIEEAKEALK